MALTGVGSGPGGSSVYRSATFSHSYPAGPEMFTIRSGMSCVDCDRASFVFFPSGSPPPATFTQSQSNLPTQVLLPTPVTEIPTISQWGMWLLGALLLLAGIRALCLGQTVGQVDVAPALLDLLDLEPLESASGESLLPLLESGAGRGAETAPTRGLYAETWLPFYTYGWAKVRVWRQGRFKWIDSPAPELYDMARDPRELADISSQEPGLAHDLSRDLGEFLDAYEQGEGVAALELDSEVREKLRSLGYLSTGTASSKSDRPSRSGRGAASDGWARGLRQVISGVRSTKRSASRGSW